MLLLFVVLGGGDSVVAIECSLFFVVGSCWVLAFQVILLRVHVAELLFTVILLMVIEVCEIFIREIVRNVINCCYCCSS